MRSRQISVDTIRLVATRLETRFATSLIHARSNTGSEDVDVGPVSNQHMPKAEAPPPNASARYQAPSPERLDRISATDGQARAYHGLGGGKSVPSLEAEFGSWRLLFLEEARIFNLINETAI